MEHFKIQFLITVLFYLGPANAVETCDAPIDLGFLIDASSTVGQHDFEKYMIGFLIETGRRYRFSPTDGFQGGVIMFGDSAKVEMYLNTCDSQSCFENELKRLNYTNAKQTRIDLALKRADKDLFQTPRGYRGGEKAGFPAYALLISDGAQNPWSNPPGQNKDAALANAKALKDRGVKIIAFGTIDESQSSWQEHEQLLKDMASPELYYKVRSVTDLMNYLDELVGATCKEPSCVQDESDTVLVVDTSNRASYLNQERDIAKGIVEQYNTKQGGNKAGLVSYRSTAASEGYYHDADAFNKKLDSLSMEGGAPHIDLALGEAAVLLGTSLAKNKALYLFTDGFLEDSLDPTQAVAQAGTLRDGGVKIIIVAMGKKPNMPFLRLLTDEENIVPAPPGEKPAKTAVEKSCTAPGPKCVPVLKEKLICPTPSPEKK